MRANSELTVTFAENVYDTDGGSGDLEAADFELSISGGVATVASTPTGISKTAQSIWSFRCEYIRYCQWF